MQALVRIRIHGFVAAATLGLMACGNDPKEGTDDVGDTSTGDSSSSMGSESQGESGSSESASTTDDEATSSESTTNDSSTTDPSDSSTTDPSDSSTDSSDSSTTDPTSTDTTSEESTETTDGCVPTELNEVTCDLLDNDCDGNVDDVDVGSDGICDCLRIGILGATGFAPSSNFEAWLEEQGTVVTRTLLANNPGVVTDALLANYDLVIVDRIERQLAPAEAQALSDFVKLDGRGMITLIGYNFDNNNPAPERDRANTALAPFGLAYQGNYVHTNAGVTPTYVQMHPIGMGITDVNFWGGIIPADIGNQGMSEVFATVPSGTAGIAHQTDMGGRVVVWGDEWITFDSDWQGFADVQAFWASMVGWAKPQDFCANPQ
jgi:hypothetical protein